MRRGAAGCALGVTKRLDARSSPVPQPKDATREATAEQRRPPTCHPQCPCSAWAVCTGCARLRVWQRQRVGEDRGDRLAAGEHECVEQARGESGDVGVAALRRGGHAAAHEWLELAEQLGLGGES